jgi:ABC-type Zn uptake system ZnuABC Zn-binding protein ZnuA
MKFINNLEIDYIISEKNKSKDIYEELKEEYQFGDENYNNQSKPFYKSP